MSRASPLFVLSLIALLVSLVTWPSPEPAWAGVGSGTGTPGQYFDDESTSDDQGDPDDLESSDGRVKVLLKPGGQGGDAPLSGPGPDVDPGWFNTGEISVLISILRAIK